MTVILETKTNRYIGDTADAKPTSVPVGSTYLDRQTSKLYITYDGTNWAQIDQIVQVGAGAAIVGKVGVDQTTPGTTNRVDTTFNNVVPGLDNTNVQKVSLYGKGSAAGDTALVVAAPGFLGVAGVDGALTTLRMGGMKGNADADPVTGVLQSKGVSLLNPSTTYDRARSIAASGAGLGVQQVGTLGELITLAASAARTESANGTAVTGLGWRNRYIILLNVTVADTDAGDTLDVYVDVSLDGSTWLNTVHFTQIIGTDAASKRYAVLDPSAPGTAEILVTADAAAGAVRPSMFGAQMRARWAITDAGTDDASFTFSVSAYAI